MASPQTPIIDVRDVSFSYKGAAIPSLHHVNLSIASGEFVAFVGQNGAGKTTLAKTFNGILAPTGGEVIVSGHNTLQVGLDVLARMVGYVYQNPDQQIFSKTVAEEVAFGPRNLGLRADEVEKRVQLALKVVEMEKDAETYPFLLGRGQRQKLAVAAVIAMNTPILVVDEPTTGLDLKGSRSIMNLLRRWNEEDGRTIIIITHDMNIVAEYTKRMVVMANSRILAQGPTRQILADQEILARAFLKSPQITRVAQALNGRFAFPHDVISVADFYCEMKKRLVSRENL